MTIEVHEEVDPVTYKVIYREGECVCGGLVDLTDPGGGMCECCGRYYNDYGQEISEPGEEDLTTSK